MHKGGWPNGQPSSRYERKIRGDERLEKEKREIVLKAYRISRCLDSGLTGTFFGMVRVSTPFS